MAYRGFGGTGVTEEGEYFETTCQSCGKESQRYEAIWNGEEVEGWSYCKDCDIETFHPIKKLTGTELSINKEQST